VSHRGRIALTEGWFGVWLVIALADGTIEQIGETPPACWPE
jgi:hypothetical protein